MIPSTQSTRFDGQYFATVDLQVSTLRMPPASAGQFGDHFEVVVDAGLVVVVVAAGLVVVGEAFVVVGEALVVVGEADGAL